MAQSYTSPKDGTFYIPGGYPGIEVVDSASGVAVNGVLFLVGEADGGPHHSLETNLALSAFGPDQEAAVVAKFKSGRLVEAYRGAVAPSNDEKLVGAPSRLYLIKTNSSAKASAALDKVGGGTYHTLADRSYGELGNLVYFTVTQKTAETIPTTGTFTALIPNNTTDLSFRVNGGASLAVQYAAADLPATQVTAIDALSGVAASGGTNRGIILVAGTLAVSGISGNQATFTRSVAWTVTPTVGDSLYIPSGSAIQGATNANRGSWVITAVASTTITATKLLDAAGAAGAITAPEAVAATAITAITDLMAFAPVTITLETAVVTDGIGKTLEINELTSSTGRLSDLAYTLNTTKVTWVSKTGAAKQLTSASEYAVYLNVNRQLDGVQEQVYAGGDVALKIGYTGTTGTVTVSSTGLTTSVTGGSGANLTLVFSRYPTLNDLATYINSQTGYTCSLGSALLGQKSPLMLDEVSAKGICSTFGNANGRIKIDAASFFDAVDTGSATVQLGTTTALNVPAAAGIPAVMASNTYLAGGTLGATTDAIFQTAVDALERLRGNFLIPLFSRDATSDITDGKTDSNSTYTIDAINAYCRTHCLKMSTMKRRRNRQAVCSYEGAFLAQRLAAANLAAFRVALAMQDSKHVSRTAGIVQEQPWFTAVLAAGMQAAGGYRGILNRQPNQSGVVHVTGDFDPINETNLEDALKSGLLVLKLDQSDRWVFASDQTTYTKDNNFYYNSIQAVYVGDLIALTTSQRMEDSIVGESIADVNATLAKELLKTVLKDLRRLKYIAPSDDAPDGYRNLKVIAKGGVYECSVEVKLAGLIYFVPIFFQVSQVTQSA